MSDETKDQGLVIRFPGGKTEPVKAMSRAEMRRLRSMLRNQERSAQKRADAEQEAVTKARIEARNEAEESGKDVADAVAAAVAKARAELALKHQDATEAEEAEIEALQDEILTRLYGETAVNALAEDARLYTEAWSLIQQWSMGWTEDAIKNWWRSGPGSRTGSGPNTAGTV